MANCHGPLSETETPSGPTKYKLGKTFAFWTVYGAICAGLLIWNRPTEFRDWPIGFEIVLCLIAPIIGTIFTASRYFLRGLPNRGRWIMIMSAIAFAAGYTFWLAWGILAVFAAIWIGFLLDVRFPLPEHETRP